MPSVYKQGAGPLPAGAVLIDRTTKYGNPFRITAHECREEVIARFENWLGVNPALVATIKRELRDKDLVCHCAPLACHGDVLLRIANA